MSRTGRTLVMALAMAALLAGCGQKGPLHRPAPAESIAPAAADADGGDVASPRPDL